MDGSRQANASRPISLLIGAMGGEGGGVLTGWIVAAARAQGLAVQATSVPGVAQRTGGTTYYVEMASRDSRGRAPVFALTPVAGQIDVVLASELVEGARAARLGFATPDRTTLIASTHRVFLIQEKMAMADGRIDPADLLATARARARRAIFLDMGELARAQGVPISPVMLGALAGAGALPIDRQHFEAAIRDSAIAVPKNLAAFEAAFASVVGERGDHRGKPPRIGVGDQVTPPAAANLAPSLAAGLATSLAAGLAPGDFIIGNMAAVPPELAGLPTAVRDVVARGIERLEDYQDREYATLYRLRLEPFRGRDAALQREVARQLALRMSYEDVIRVAQAKARAARYDRIQGELGAGANEPFEVQDFFKPGVRELADILPPALARFVLRRTEHSAWLQRAHVGMKVRTTTISGYLRVWLLARLKPWRRRTYRFAQEQAATEAWLGLVRQADASGDVALALEIVELARLIKGYGDTHARGLFNYAAIVDTLVRPALDAATVQSGNAAGVRAAREAALADPEGKSLDSALAKTRTNVAQPAA